MNPYTARIMGLLGDRPPIEVLEATPSRIREQVRRMGPEGLNRSSAPGKWTAKQILAHLADAEMAVGFRLRQVLAEDNHTIQPFDQDRWAARYRAVDVEAALAALTGLRSWNVSLIRGLAPSDLERPAMHPERGPESAGHIIKMLAGHDLNHLQQLETIAAGQGKASP